MAALPFGASIIVGRSPPTTMVRSSIAYADARAGEVAVHTALAGMVTRTCLRMRASPRHRQAHGRAWRMARGRVELERSIAMVGATCFDVLVMCVFRAPPGSLTIDRPRPKASPPKRHGSPPIKWGTAAVPMLVRFQRVMRCSPGVAQTTCPRRTRRARRRLQFRPAFPTSCRCAR